MFSIISTPGRSAFLFSMLMASVLLACDRSSAPGAGSETALADEYAAGPVAIEAEPQNLLSFDPSHDRIDQLRWRAGFEIRSSHPSLGGLSGMVLLDDHLMAASDRGHWWISPLKLDAAGTLVAIGDGILLPILGPDGEPVEGRFENDAEEISSWGDGLVVGFEGKHRLHLYSHDSEDRSEGDSAGAVPDGAGIRGPFGAFESLARQPGRLLEVPAAFDGIDDNGGLEAVTELADGRLLIFAEEGRDAEGDTRGWIGNPETGEWQELSLALTVDPEVGDLRPTAATTLDSGDVVLLERGWQAIAGVVVKVALLPAGQIEAGRRLMPFELGRLRAPYTVDNFEAIEASTGPGGETLLYLLADDNFRDDQRTLLLQFEVIGERPIGAMGGLDR